MDYIIHTPCGPVRGCPGRLSGTVAYKGIRYATAGRWEYPRQVTSWDGVYDATAYGHCAYQARSFRNEEESPKKIFYYYEFRRGETYTYSEDCLFLNIWTPEGAREGDKLPVLLYIHGGSFTGGCGHEKHLDGPVWPTKGIIGVTINYRLGPQGFACLPQLKEEAGIAGNYGLYDQLTAMQWVRANIAAFGGDPENMTIMGQSAGAISVQQHCLSPLTDGLFRRAVMSSGGGVSKIFRAADPEKAYGFWQTCMEKAGCKDLAAFRALPADRLFAAWQETRKVHRSSGCFPVIDGRFVVGTGLELLQAGKQKHISYLCGCTSQDMIPPILFAMNKNWCEAQEKPSYCWYFDRQLPGDNNGAWHCSDLWYWFGTLPNCWRPLEQKDFALSSEMTDYLCNFARTGDPNGAGLAAWPPAGKANGQVMRLGEKTTGMDRPSRLKMVYTMLTNKYVGK